MLVALALPVALAAPPPEVAEVWAQVAAPQAVSARFEATQTRRILQHPQASSGTLLVARPDRLAWRWETPAPSVLTLSGDRIGVADPALGLSQEVDLAAMPEVAGLVRGATVWMGGDWAKIEEDFQATWRADGATLVPRDPELGTLIARLELRVGGSPATLTGFEVVEPDGDTLSVRLSDVQRDPPLPADAFALPKP
jgi:outer membrane lipoprotein-sorting protein